MVHEAVRGEHLKHMRQLNQHLADGACSGHVLSGNLGQNQTGNELYEQDLQH